MSTTTHRSVRDEADLRTAIVDACASMQRAGLTRGTAGNISARFGDGVLITPSAVPYDSLRPEDVVLIDHDGAPRLAGRRPSSEWRMHVEIMRRRPDVGAIVHTHSPYATALACLRRAIPPFHYMVAAAGGADIPCAPYAGFGTTELARLAAACLAERDACLLANHGAVAIGRDVAGALGLAIELEGLAHHYVLARQLGEPVLLDAAEMTDALAAFREYRG